MSSRIRNVVTWSRTSVSWQATQDTLITHAWPMLAPGKFTMPVAPTQDLRRERAGRIEPPTGYTLVRKENGRWEQLAPVVASMGHSVYVWDPFGSLPI